MGDARERLLDALARLIRLRGCEAFVTAPLLLPDPRFFPERWERSLRGAGRLLARLLRYAGLDTFAVRLRGFRRRASEVGERVWIRQYGDSAAAWYAGTHDGVCHFGLELRGLDNEELLVAALAHEVAHAFREAHALCARDRDAEEKLTDLTAVYLGFGVFLANASLLVESGGYSEGGQRLLYERHSLGYLSPAEFALLLSAQVVARGRAEERRALRTALRPNHARLFELGCEELANDASALRARLGVPEPADWPAGPVDELLFKPVTDDDIECIEPETETEMAPSVGAREREPSTRVSFRVRRTSGALFAMCGLGAAFALGALSEPPGMFWPVLLAVGGYGGFRWGASRRSDECSDCQARLELESERCDACGARLVGAIADRAERLHALEHYQASLPRPPASAANDFDDPLAELLTAMFLAWGYGRGLANEASSEAARALERRCAAGDFDTRALARTWVKGGALNDEGTAFGRYYIRSAEARVRARDLQIVRTAASFGDDPQSYRRFATVLDRRFEEWRAAAGGRPLHVL